MTQKYFSWGDTIGKNKNGSGSYSFSDTNYAAGLCGSGHILWERWLDIPQGDPTYDAATSNMGSRWKMPTKHQGQELIDKTKHTWTTINGVKGYKFTSKTDSSKYIFLPAAGEWSATEYRGTEKYGSYWTSSRDNSNSWVWFMALYSPTVNTNPLCSLRNNGRYPGNSVRAIQYTPSLYFLAAFLQYALMFANVAPLKCPSVKHPVGIIFAGNT